MLRIRFSRTGKVGQPSFRIVVAERSAPVKGKSVEVVGNYLPARNPKQVVVEKERILHWISKGAIPTSAVASLLKAQGFANMDKYFSAPTHKRKKKGEEAEKSQEKPAAAGVAEATAEAPAAK